MNITFRNTKGSPLTPAEVDNNFKELFNPGVFNVRVYGAIGNGTADDTVAIQAAINACHAAGGGMVLFPDGLYKCNGAINATTRSVLYFPQTVAGSPYRSIELRGSTPAAWISYDAEPSTSGAVIFSSTVGTTPADALIGGGAINGNVGTAKFNYITARLTNLTIRTTDNPTLNGANFWQNACAAVDSCSFDTGMNQFAVARPTNDRCGLIMPQVDNHGLSDVLNTCVGGYMVGVRFSEHTFFKNACSLRCLVAVEAMFSYHASGGQLNIFHCPTALRITNGGHTVSFDPFDLERSEIVAAGNWWKFVEGMEIDDPTDSGRGKIEYKITKADVGNIIAPISYTGCSKIKFNNLFDFAVTSTPTPAGVTGLAIARTNTAGVVNATWNAYPSATAYNIRYRLANGSYSGINIGNITGTSQTISGLNADFYAFQVQAIVSGTPGPWSAEVSQTAASLASGGAGEVLKNFEFDSPATTADAGWEAQQGATISNGGLNLNGNTNTVQLIALTVGVTYVLTATLRSCTVGVVQVVTDTGENGQLNTGASSAVLGAGSLTATTTFVANRASDILIVRGSGSTNAVVESITIHPA